MISSPSIAGTRVVKSSVLFPFFFTVSMECFVFLVECSFFFLGCSVQFCRFLRAVDKGISVVECSV